MAKLNIILENPNSLPVNLTINSNIPLSQLKEELLANSSLPQLGTDGKPIAYEVFCMRTGSILNGPKLPVSYMLRDGDQLILQNSAVFSNAGITPPALVPDSDNFEGTNTVPNQTTIDKDDFNVTAVDPFPLDFKSKYPVLAIYKVHNYNQSIVIRNRRQSEPGDIFSNTRWMCVKEIYFLIADSDHKFKWVSPAKSRYYLPELSRDIPDYTRSLTQYSLDNEKRIKENKNMIIPVRPFSITDINMDGFSPGKEYPVLAMDID